MSELEATLNPEEYCLNCGKKLTECTCNRASINKVFTLGNLNCAHCAGKIETALNQMEGVKKATLTFPLKKLEITVDADGDWQSKVQRLCDSIENGVVVSANTGTATAATKEEEERNALGLTENQMEKAEIIVGGIIFVAAEWLNLVPEAYKVWVLLLGYVILGRDIVLQAIKNLLKGNALDENFLMSLATIGSFGIKCYEEAVGVMLFYRIGEYFEDRAVEKSRSQIMGAVDLRPEVVNLVEGDGLKTVPAADAQVGDILLVRAGERIPLDGIVVEGESMLDTAAITGEPVPVRKTVNDKVMSGCINTNAMLKIRVEKVLAESMVTKILNSVENAAASKPKIDRFITRFARVYTPIVVAAAVAVVLAFGLMYGEWYKGIYTALTFLVISCPCALVLSVPLAFFAGIGAASKQGILFKGGIAIESLNKVKAVVMDKTGTITLGNFQVQKLYPATGFTDKDLLSLCAAAEQMSTHPIAKSIVERAKEEQITLEQPASFEEFAGEGLSAQLKQGRVLCGNSKLLTRFNIASTLPQESGTLVLVAKDNDFAGAILIGDTIKPDAVNAIDTMKQLGMSTVMLTGDSQKSAEAVAAKVGVTEVHAQMLPQDKLSVLQDLRTKLGGVMFVGDGINDAPVLAGADVGAAMGSGADAAIEAADVVFLNSKLSCVPTALGLAKTTTAISWQNVYFAIGVKFVILLAGICGYASMWAAVFADTGVAALCVLNSIRILYKKI